MPVIGVSKVCFEKVLRRAPETPTERSLAACRPFRLLRAPGNCGTAITSLFVIGLVACTTIREPLASVTAPVSRLSFAYVENFSGNSISMFTVSPTGLWTPTTPKTVPFSNLAESLVVDSSSHFLYVPNSRNDTVSMFSIDPESGLLSPLSSTGAPTGADPQYIAIDPRNRFVYTSNSDDNTLSAFVRGAGGLLLPATPAATSTGGHPVGLAIDPSGHFLYDIDDSGVSMFAIDQTSGLLAPIAPGHVAAGVSPFTITIDPSGRYAYVPDNGAKRVSIFAIDQQTGALQAASLRLVPVGDGPTQMAIDPTSQFAYVVNRGDGSISEFTIDPTTGNLLPMQVPVISTLVNHGRFSSILPDSLRTFPTRHSTPSLFTPLAPQANSTFIVRLPPVWFQVGWASPQSQQVVHPFRRVRPQQSIHCCHSLSELPS